ncbi:hypothetical protein K1X76_05835 [bacterium]|nr:hypothetical protein [bacterium]
MMKFKMTKMAVFMALMGLTQACNPNITSSELKETKASDLKITGTFYEYNDEDQVDATALLKTIPDGTGIQLNQGETLKVGTKEGSDPVDYTLMSYDYNFLDIGETYKTKLDKPAVGEDYYLIYKDVDGVETTAQFSSQGVPELITPAQDDIVEPGSEVSLTWTKKNLGKLYVDVSYTTTDGASGWTQFSTSDDGSYTLDLDHYFFDDLASGDMTISLRHDTAYESMEGFGDADIRISTYSRRTVTVESLDTALHTTRAFSHSQKYRCAEGESKKVKMNDAWVDYCL